MKTEDKSQAALEVVAAVIIKNGKILITQRPEGKRQANFWEFPGGKIEEGEAPQTALQRELREELDITINVGVLVASVLHRYDWGKVEIQAYLCEWTGGQIKHLEVKDHRWVTPVNLANYDILPADFPIIDKLQMLNFA